MHKFTQGAHWLFEILSFVRIGLCDYFGFCLTSLFWLKLLPPGSVRNTFVLTLFEIPFYQMFRHNVHDVGYESPHSQHILWNCYQKSLLLTVSFAVRKHGRYMVPQKALIKTEISKSRFFFYLEKKIDTKKNIVFNLGKPNCCASREKSHLNPRGSVRFLSNIPLTVYIIYISIDF